MAAASFIRQLLTWIPDHFMTFTNLIVTYLNANSAKLWTMSLYLTFAVSVVVQLLTGYQIYGLSDTGYSFIRTMMVFLDGFLFRRERILGVEESYHSVVQ